MGNPSHADYLMMIARTSRGPSSIPVAGIPVEADLHDEIFSYCRTHGWVALHGSMANRTHRTKGEPDFVILASLGRVFFIECKSGDGKLSVDQVAMRAQAAQLGHEIHVVRNFRQFLEVVK